ncbi:MAG: porin family protein [Bacteroidales bacterium]|nr:porin family protein [Bacteroidales bacterium]
MRYNVRIFALAVGLATMTAISAPAETHYKPHVSIGAHGGMNMSQMSFSPSVPQNWTNGIQIGVQARYAEEKIFGIIGELNFSQRGWKERFDDHPDLDYSRTLTYIDLPVMTHIYFGSNRFKGFVNLGPQVSYLISDNISSNFDYAHPQEAGIPTSRYTAQMSMKVKNRFDYGITAGLGGEYYIKPRHSAYLEVRFYYGLGNIYPSSKSDTFSASRSMSLQFTAGYNFRLK